MNKKILDSSAILAVIFDESGAEKVEPLLERSIVSSVNIAEVLSKLAENGGLDAASVEDIQKLGIEIIDLDLEQAIKAAELRPLTKHLGLSLGDRCCLALAMLRDTIAVTADRDWRKLKFCKIEVIR